MKKRVICSTFHCFSFLYPGLDFFMSNSAGVSRTADAAYPTGVSGPCSQFLVESELFIYNCCLICIILGTLCSLLGLSVFYVWSSSLDYILSARILVPLIYLLYSIDLLLNDDIQQR